MCCFVVLLLLVVFICVCVCVGVRVCVCVCTFFVFVVVVFVFFCFVVVYDVSCFSCVGFLFLSLLYVSSFRSDRRRLMSHAQH